MVDRSISISVILPTGCPQKNVSVFVRMKSKTETFFCGHPVCNMQTCELLGCRIDYLATHDYTGDADQVMDKLEMLYNRLQGFKLKLMIRNVHCPQIWTENLVNRVCQMLYQR